jgi:hypothetical protein
VAVVTPEMTLPPFTDLVCDTGGLQDHYHWFARFALPISD